MNKSESIGKLALALSKAQASMRGAVKDATNPFFKSKYADLEAVWEAIRKPLADNELSISQLTSYNDEAKTFCIETLLMHSSGEFLIGSFPLLTKDNSPQAMGSATSYARRYALAACMGVTQVDDDAQAAQPKHDLVEKKYSTPKYQDFLPPNADSPRMGTVITTMPPKYDEFLPPNAEVTAPKLYIPQFGKFAGKPLDTLRPADIENYIVWLEGTAKKKNEPLKQNVIDFIKAATEHLNNLPQDSHELPMNWE